MRAISITKPGPPSVLKLIDLPKPTAGSGEVVIKVKAAGINRPDIAQRLGRYPVPADASPIPGLEVSGVVDEIGGGVDPKLIGRSMMALTHGGGYAEYCKVDASHCLPKPEPLSFVEAAAIPEVGFTVEFNMVMRGGLSQGESVLIHGGSSGIGSHAIQRAKALNTTVFTTCGTEEKVDYCKALGADHAFNYRTEDWELGIQDLTGGRGVDVVLDMVGGDYFQKNLNCIAADGRYALIARQRGNDASIQLNTIMRRRITISGSTLRPLPKDRKTKIAEAFRNQVLPHYQQGGIKPSVFCVFPLEEATRAHELLESGTHKGKIVLEM